jgi:hypothetical protein
MLWTKTFAHVLCGLPDEISASGGETKGACEGRGKEYSPEHIVNILQQIAAGIATRKTRPVACREAGIVERSFVAILSQNPGRF